MKREYLIAVDEFCTHHNIENSFISSLQETGLIEITTIDETGFIDARQLEQLEKFIRFHYDLDINLEGIETITHLLQRIISMRDEIIALKNKLRFYETND
jgi:hypothetical protein